MPGLFTAILLLATFLCALVAGFLFAFVVVAMPGIGSLDDGAFIRAFQRMDRIIQNNQPVFMLVWLGSAVLLLGSAVLGFGRLAGVDRLLLLAATLLYMLGVQVPTAVVNVPLNNQLQAHDVDRMDEAERDAARRAFEPRWNRWNGLRTVLASLATALLMVLLYRL